MKITVLVDNNTFIDQYYYGEPAVSYYLEIDDKKILFDAGYSDIFLKNAQKLNIDLAAITHLVFSHGHNDHTNGIKYLEKLLSWPFVRLIAHPECLLQKRIGDEYIGPPPELALIAGKATTVLTKKPYYISANCLFLGEIPVRNDFESRVPIGEQLLDGIWQDDLVLDDSALVCRTNEGLFIITGCSHSGICNIIEQAKNIMNEDKVVGVIGGFHLLEQNMRLDKTILWLKQQKISNLYPCHCVSLSAKAQMLTQFAIKEVGVGLTIKMD